MCRYSNSGGQALSNKFQERWNLKTQTSLNISTLRRFCGGGGRRGPGNDDESFWSCGRGIQWRMLNGSPPHISVIKRPSVKTLQLTEFLKTDEAITVSVGRNSSWGGSSCGNFCCFAWGCHGHWFGTGVTLAPACHLARPVLLPWAQSSGYQ